MSATNPGFAADGVITTPLRPSSEDGFKALAYQGDGELLLAGAAGGDFGLTRLNDYLYPGVAFGADDGKVTTDFGGTEDVAQAVAETADGGVVAAGSAGGDMAIALYERHGLLDRSFDGDGRLTVDLGSDADSAYGVVPLADGRVVVVGGTPTSAAIIRLLDNGTPDPSFGVAGTVVGPTGGPARAVAIQSDGKLLVAGGGGDRMAVSRHLASGIADPDFGDGGVATVLVGAPASATAMAVGADGRITIAGSRGSDIAVARVLPDGTADPTFGTAGTGFTIFDLGGHESAYGLAVKANGALLVVGDSGDRGLAVRYRADGTLEPAFGTGGYKVAADSPVWGNHLSRFRAVVAHSDVGWILAGALDSDAAGIRVYEPRGEDLGGRSILPAHSYAVDFGHSIQEVTDTRVQPDGKILVLARLGGDTALVRYNPDGSRDLGFGAGGVVISDRASLPSALTLGPDGSIVVAGAGFGDSGLVATLLRFRNDGSTDTSFGTDGRVIGMPGKGDGYASSLAARPDGRFLLASRHGDDGIGLAQYTSSGTLDTTFGSQGYVEVATDSRSAKPRILLLPDGRILASWSASGISRLLANGSSDPSFGVDGTVKFTSSIDVQGPTVLGLQPDSRILVAGTTRTGYGAITVIRLLADGSADPTWQIVPASFTEEMVGGTAVSEPSSLTSLPDGRVLVGGLAANPVLLSLNPDGTRDKAFGTDGMLGLRVQHGGPPIAVVQTAKSGLVVVASGEDRAAPTTGVRLLRIATGPLGVPVSVAAVAGAGAVRVTWAPPALFDESPIRAYKVTSSDGAHSVTTPDGAHLSAIVRGLPVGGTYTFTVQAVRDSGIGPESAPSNAVTTDIAMPTSAWGWNGLGQMGTGTTVDSRTPVTGVGVTGAVALAGGAYHSLALRADGTVWAWGWNGFGQLGDGSNATRSTAVRVQRLGNIVAVAAGAHHSLALGSDGSVWAWGWNGLGQLGVGNTVDSNLPVRVPGLVGVKAIGAGLGHTLAVQADRTVLAWGWNILGQLGNGTKIDTSVPRPVIGLTNVTAVAGGVYHSIALRSDGTVRAWGWNGVGQLGTGDYVDRLFPAEVQGLMRITAIAAGAYQNYALELGRGERVRSWGWNYFGQLGNDSNGIQSGILEVGATRDVVAIAAGWHHGLALHADGTVTTWGFNALGQLGNGGTADSRSPVTVPLPKLTFAVGGGALHSLSA